MSITTKLGQIRKMPSFEDMDSFGYHLLRVPLESLIIAYPIEHLEDEIKSIVPVSKLTSEEVESLSESSSEDLEEELSEKEPEIEIVQNKSIEPSIKKYEYEPQPVGENLTGESQTGENLTGESQTGENQMGENQSGGDSEENYINASDLTGKRGLKRIMNYNHRLPIERKAEA